MKDILRNLLRALLWPVRKGLRLDEAFRRQLEVTEQHAEHARARFDQIDRRFDQIEARMTRLEGLADALRELNEQGRDAMVATAAQFGSEVARFGSEVARLSETRHAIGTEIAHRLMHDAIGQGLPGVESGVADLLNFSESHRGFRADAGLYFNPPVVVEYREGEVNVSQVNERIVEVPFVMASLAGLPAGARILDVGADESTLALSLASLGYAVTALDINGYPLRHPNLTAVRQSLDDYTADEPFDAIVCLSSIEHFGLGHYGPDSGGEDADVRALARLRGLSRDRGLLILTAPFGAPSVSDFQRVYDEQGLRHLLEGWEDVSLQVAHKVHDTVWLPGPPGDASADGPEQVALVTALAPKTG